MPVVLLSHPLADSDAQRHLERLAEVRIPGQDTQECFSAALQGVDAVIIRAPSRMDAGTFDQAQGLRVVANIGTGVDHIDTETAAARGIDVLVGAGANATAVAEWVIWATLTLRRRFGVAASFASRAEPSWSTRIGELRGRETSTGTLGVIGYGHIGRAVARMAHQGLGMRIAAFDPALDAPAAGADIWCASLEELLRVSEVVSVHVPLVEATRHLIGPAELELLGADGILINAARGGVVDEDAVVLALRENRLLGAALDVFADEPPPVERLHELARVPNLVTTPHIAGISREAGSAFAWAAVHGVLQALGLEDR